MNIYFINTADNYILYYQHKPYVGNCRLPLLNVACDTKIIWGVTWASPEIVGRENLSNITLIVYPVPYIHTYVFRTYILTQVKYKIGMTFLYLVNAIKIFLNYLTEITNNLGTFQLIFMVVSFLLESNAKYIYVCAYLIEFLKRCWVGKRKSCIM